jgi:hypothetical protein
MHRTSQLPRDPKSARRPVPWLESLEGRVHQSFTLTTSSYISDISGYSLFAEACYGDNGEPWGQEEIGMGNSQGSYFPGDIYWDADLSDGLDSGQRQVYFRADAGDDLGVWWVDGGDMLVGSMNLDRIGAVMIRVGVMQPQMSMTWESAAIAFLNNGRLVKSEGLGTIQASTMDEGWQEETIVHVDMPSLAFDEVRIGGLIRLEAAQGVYPSPNDMFAQVFVYDAPQGSPVGS